MPRIIAGELGGRTIPGPPGSRTRPTSDRVREALFSRLQGWDAIEGRRVLDLYAGTGALAFEALSRGATAAVLVEAHARTAQQITRTARELGLAARTTVRSAAVESVVPGLVDEVVRTGAQPFALVLIDPPYDVATSRIEQLLAGLLPALAPDAVVVVERSSRTAPPQWPAGFLDDGERTYGETRVHFGEPAGSEADTAAPEPAEDVARDIAAPASSTQATSAQDLTSPPTSTGTIAPQTTSTQTAPREHP